MHQGGLKIWARQADKLHWQKAAPQSEHHQSHPHPSAIVDVVDLECLAKNCLYNCLYINNKCQACKEKRRYSSKELYFNEIP